MRLMIESTKEVEKWSGPECQVWSGTTELGLPLKVLVMAIVLPAGSPLRKVLDREGIMFVEEGPS